MTSRVPDTPVPSGQTGRLPQETAVDAKQETCGARFALHPTEIGLVAVCQLPPGHKGRHDNLPPEPEVP